MRTSSGRPAWERHSSATRGQTVPGRRFTLLYYANLGFQALEPNPDWPADSFYLAVGNCCGYPSSGPMEGRVECIKKVGGNWQTTPAYTSLGAGSNFAVNDVTAMRDPSLTSNDPPLLYWATQKMDRINWCGLPRGMVTKRKWVAGTYTYTNLYTYNYADGTQCKIGDIIFYDPPACVGLTRFLFRNSYPVVIAALYGKVVGDEPIYQAHLFAYQDTPGPAWKRLNTPAVLSTSTIEIFLCFGGQIEVDAANGYDIYVTGQGGCYWLDNRFQDSPLGSGCNLPTVDRPICLRRLGRPVE